MNMINPYIFIKNSINRLDFMRDKELTEGLTEELVLLVAYGGSLSQVMDFVDITPNQALAVYKEIHKALRN